MKLVILAAGEGSRLYPLTKDIPKCMVPYKDKPIIDYILEATDQIEERYIVSGYQHDKLYAYTSSRVTGFFQNNSFEQSNMVYSMLQAKELFNDDLIISYADIIYPKTFIDPLLASNNQIDIIADINWLTLWKQRFENPLDDCESFGYDQNNYLYEIGSKCSSTDETMAGYVGLIRFSNDVLNYILTLDLDPNMYMTDLLQLLAKKYKTKVHLVQDDWLEVDTQKDLAIEIKI